MNTVVLKKVETPFMKQSLPKVEVGDTVNVTTILRDDKGQKKRTQDFKGIVIAQKNGGIRTTITVRKISHGIGVEKIFPIHSTNIESIEIIKKGKVRRAKIYYMRNRIGKKAMKIDESDKGIEMVTYIEDQPIGEDGGEEEIPENEEAEEVQEEEVEVEEEVEDKKS